MNNSIPTTVQSLIMTRLFKITNSLVFLLFISTQTWACDFAGINFQDNFSAARLDGCKQTSAASFQLTITPENTPINPSPWYAFKITSDKKRRIKISIDYGKPKSRYQPKISYDGINWQMIKHKVKGGDLHFKLKLNAGTVWIAGQEIINNQFYDRWLKALDSLPNARRFILGHSTQMRHIQALEHRNDSNEWVIIIGRMHPPEITGAIALFPFVETMLTAPNMSTLFNSRFNLLVIPNLNPDGVEHGNWRHNVNGVDLNRDWLKFEQAETQLVRDKLNQIVNDGGKIVYAIDFHSTSKNIFYTMPSDYGLKPALMTENWLNALNLQTPDMEVVMQPGNNPDKGVFKQYIADQFGVHAITYEMDDNYDRDAIRSFAKLAALSFMQTLLNTQSNDFQ